MELLAVINQEIQRRRIDHFVGEQSSSQEQEHGREHKRQHVAFFVPIKAGGDEKPDLVEHEGGSHEQAGKKCDLQVKVEGFGRIQIDQLLGHPIALERVHHGALYETEDELVIVPAGEESHRHRNQ